MKKEYEVAVRWTAYLLRPNTPEEGLSLEQVFPGKDINEMNDRLKKAANEAGLPFGYRTMRYNMVNPQKYELYEQLMRDNKISKRNE